MNLKHKSPVIISLALLAALLGFVAWKMGWVEWALTMKEPVLGWCRSHPLALFAAIAILPGFGFPVAPLLILAGAVWGSNSTGCALALLAVTVNITWSHLLAAGPGSKTILRLLGSRWQPWQNIPSKDHWRISCLLRVTPSIPLFVQNYMIGILGIPLFQSLAIALPITGLYVCGFVLTGGAIFQGQIGLFIIGVSVLVAATLAIKIIRARLITSPAPKPNHL
jgi:uncharacterized membrane protein YdjX (TVP38/TMEM64 family)